MKKKDNCSKENFEPEIIGTHDKDFIWILNKKLTPVYHFPASGPVSSHHAIAGDPPFIEWSKMKYSSVVVGGQTITVLKSYCSELSENVNLNTCMSWQEQMETEQ